MTWLQLFHWLSTHQLLVFLVTLFSAASHWLQALSNTTSSGEEKIPPKIKISSQSISVMANRLLLYFLPLQWGLNSRVQLAATKSEQLSALDHLVAKGLQEGNDIQEDESLINLSMIMTNMAPEEAEGPESVFTHLDLYLISLLTHSTKSSRFRLLIISDATLAGLLRLHLKMSVNIQTLTFLFSFGSGW